MADNPVDISALQDRDYSGPATQRAQQTRLDESWRALHFEEGMEDLDARLASGELDLELVIDVVAAAAMRALDNPNGRESESYALDDYQESWKRVNATADIYFTAAELRRVRPRVASGDVTGSWSGSMRYIP